MFPDFLLLSGGQGPTRSGGGGGEEEDTICLSSVAAPCILPPHSGLTERCQLGVADAAALHAVQKAELAAATAVTAGTQAPKPQGGGTVIGGVDLLGATVAARHLPGTWHFPSAHIKEMPTQVMLSRVRIRGGGEGGGGGGPTHMWCLLVRV